MNATSNRRTGIGAALERDAKESRRAAVKERRAAKWYEAGAASTVILLALLYLGIILGWPHALFGDPSPAEVLQRGVGLIGLKGVVWFLVRRADRRRDRQERHYSDYRRRKDLLRAYQVLKGDSLRERALAKALLAQHRVELSATASNKDAPHDEPEEGGLVPAILQLANEGSREGRPDKR